MQLRHRPGNARLRRDHTRLRRGHARLLTAIGHGMALSAVALTVGCDTKGFVDPTELGRFRKDPLVLPIVSQVDPAVEGADTQWANATEPTADDLKPDTGDYHISPNDLLAINLSDLNGPNSETLRQSRVTQSGDISLPLLKQSLHAAGMTEIQLERAIVDAYRAAQLIENANVSVTVLEARGRAFSILGAVGAAGQYPIVQSDFRLLDALVMAKDVTSPFVNYIYVLRPPEEQYAAPPAAATPNAAPTSAPTTGPSSDELAPKTRADAPPEPIASADSVRRVQHLATAGDDGNVKFDGFRDPSAAGSTRVIRISFEGLRRGDLKYNIAIRPHDTIFVAQPQAGFYFVGGHVAHPGAFALSGQRLTIKDAIISASMLDGLAIPQRTDIIRQVQPDHEVFVRVDLSKIFSGEEPDVYLKPGDEIYVGSNALAPFLAAVRGGFRITYGFGFLYDRNYAYSSALQAE